MKPSTSGLSSSNLKNATSCFGSLTSTLKGKAAATTTVTPSRTFHQSTTSSKPSTSTSPHSLPNSTPSPQLPLPTSTSTAISLLKTQPSHYVLTSISGRVYLLSPSDVVTVPHLKDVNVGDILTLTRIHEVGSRDYTLRAQSNLTERKRGLETNLIERIRNGSKIDVSNPSSTLSLLGSSSRGIVEGEEQVLRTSTTSFATKLLPNGLAHTGSTLREETVRVKVLVLEHTKGKLEKIEKTKRRKGYKKTIQHKGWWTKLRVEGIEIGEEGCQRDR